MPPRRRQSSASPANPRRSRESTRPPAKSQARSPSPATRGRAAQKRVDAHLNDSSDGNLAGDGLASGTILRLAFAAVWMLGASRPIFAPFLPLVAPVYLVLLGIQASLPGSAPGVPMPWWTQAVLGSIWGSLLCLCALLVAQSIIDSIPDSISGLWAVSQVMNHDAEDRLRRLVDVSAVAAFLAESVFRRHAIAAADADDLGFFSTALDPGAASEARAKVATLLTGVFAAASLFTCAGLASLCATDGCADLLGSPAWFALRWQALDAVAPAAVFVLAAGASGVLGGEERSLAGSFANFAVASCALLTLLRGYLPALGKILLPSAGGLHAVPAMPVITATDFAPLLAALTAAIMAPGPAPALRSVPEQMVAIADALERIALHTAAHGAASVIDAATLMGVYNFLYKVLTAKPPPGGGLDELAEAILPIVGVLAVAAVDGGRTHFALVARRIKAMTAFVSRRAEAVINANENERGFKHPLRPILLEINDLAGIIGTPAGVLAGTPQAARALGLCNAALAAAQQRLSAAGRQKDQAFADSPDFGALVQDLRALQDTKAAARAVLVRICRLNNELAALPSTGGEALPSTGGEAPPPSQRLVQRRAALEAALAAAGAEFTAAEAAFNGLLPAGIAFAPASVLWGGPDWQGAWNAWRQGGAAAAVQRLIRPHARALAPALLADDPDAPAGSGPDELYKLQHWIDREERMVAALTAVIAGA